MIIKRFDITRNFEGLLYEVDLRLMVKDSDLMVITLSNISEFSNLFEEAFQNALQKVKRDKGDPKPFKYLRKNARGLLK